VSELGKKHENQIAINNLDATTGDRPQIQRDLGFASHGLVIHDAQGEVVFKQSDHAVKKEDVYAFVAEALSK